MSLLNSGVGCTSVAQHDDATVNSTPTRRVGNRKCECTIRKPSEAVSLMAIRLWALAARIVDNHTGSCAMDFEDRDLGSWLLRPHGRFGSPNLAGMEFPAARGRKRQLRSIVIPAHSTDLARISEGLNCSSMCFHFTIRDLLWLTAWWQWASGGGWTDMRSKRN